MTMLAEPSPRINPATDKSGNSFCSTTDNSLSPGDFGGDWFLVSTFAAAFGAASAARTGSVPGLAVVLGASRRICCEAPSLAEFEVAVRAIAPAGVLVRALRPPLARSGRGG